MAERKKRRYNTGSIFWANTEGRWYGRVQAGWDTAGRRRVITRTSTIPGRAGYRAVELAIEKVKADIAKNGVPQTNTRTTVKTWAEEWLTRRVTKIRPKAYATDAGAINRWIIPVIGTRTLADLRPADIRAVHAAILAAAKPSTAARYHATMMKLLRDAMLEGHPVPPNVILTEGPGTSASDREALDVADAAAILALAATDLPHATRWVAALLLGLRPSETLGLTWAAYDRVDDGIDISWQLQALPYADKADRGKGFRVPIGYEARPLKGRLHLVRPKTAAGRRVIPKLPWFADAMEAWRKIAPASPHDLVWPALDGGPADAKQDLAEWKALQATLGISHPAGRFYVVHETRHTTASLLARAGEPREVIEAILGQVKLVEAYLHTSTAQKAGATARLGAALQLIAAPAPAAIEGAS